MAKLKMKNISIAVMKKEKKQLVALLQNHGVVELKSQPMQDGFAREDTVSQRLSFERTVQTAAQALDVLDEYSPEKSGMLDFLNGRKIIDVDDYHKYAEKSKETLKACYDLVALEKQLGDCRAEVSRLGIALDELRPWMSLDVPTGFAGTKYTKAAIGSLSGALTAGEIIELIKGAGMNADFDVEIVSADKIRTNLFAVSHRDDFDELDAALRKIGFAYVSNPDRVLLCTQKAEKMRDRRDALINECDVIIALIGTFAPLRDTIRFFVDYYATRAQRYKVYGELLQSKNTVLIEGYIPEKYSAAVQQEIEERFCAAVEISEPSEDEDVPVALCNNAFNRPCQDIVTMYSPPSKTDVDPTSTMAFFFYLFFGFMLSDAGYGLIIFLATLFVLKKFTLEDSMKNTMTMFMYCGISTMFWGFLFGGFFGDLIPKLADTYFNVQFEMPKLLDPVNDALQLLIFGIALGTVHIFAGMIINFVNLCRQGKVWDAVFDVGLWLLTLTAVIMLLVGSVLGYTVVGEIGKWAFIAGLVGLVLTQGRHSKGIGKLVSGVASLYDITGYASDMLSYSRLMALGLATGVFAQVINQLGMSPGILGFIVFLVVFIIGNAISFAMNALGAYVHTIRLQYVEYFAKFYEGGGRLFNPFTATTKYFRLKKGEK